MKIWSSDNPKATMMLQKRTAIIESASKIFLETGYAESSMNRIADAANVSIKTVYRHFENKDDLFVAVIQDICKAFSGEDESVDIEPSWFVKDPLIAFSIAGEAYLRHMIHKDHIALFRVLNQDSQKFPELGRRYQQEVIYTRNFRFTGYLEKWKEKYQWKIENPELAANSFAALLRGQIFEDMLLGLHQPTEEDIIEHVRKNVAIMLQLLGNNNF